MEQITYRMSSRDSELSDSEHTSFVQKTQQSPISLLIVTWNLMGTLPTQGNIQLLLEPQTQEHDLIVIGTQECERSLFASFFCEGKERWVHLLCNVLEEWFVMIESVTMQGLHIVGFIRKEKLELLSDVYSSKIKTGFCGCVGNKGAIQLGFSIGAKKFLFINNHLEAHQNKSSKRNKDLNKIINEMVEVSLYDQAFLFGDLNYRIVMTSDEFIEFRKGNQDYLELLEQDQFRREAELDFFKSTFKEGRIKFQPTYKMYPSSNEYNINRIPGWTDRIFFRSDNKDLILKDYNSRPEILGSDHRPVFASFITKFKQRKQGKVLMKKNKKNYLCC